MGAPIGPRDLRGLDFFENILPEGPALERMAVLIAENPLVWFIEVDGLVADSRTLPIEYQVVAFQRGYIPYIPALGPEGTAAVADPEPREVYAGTGETRDDTNYDERRVGREGP
jgi:hypothetical protein